LSADRANAARRIMQQNGLGPNQVSQIRGYADQRLRKPADPENPANRRISVIVHYMQKPNPDDDEQPVPKEGAKDGPKERAPAAAPAERK
jgi:chemotaxis protein MotB